MDQADVELARIESFLRMEMGDCMAKAMFRLREILHDDNLQLRILLYDMVMWIRGEIDARPELSADRSHALRRAVVVTCPEPKRVEWRVHLPGVERSEVVEQFTDTWTRDWREPAAFHEWAVLDAPVSGKDKVVSGVSAQSGTEFDEDERTRSTTRVLEAGNDVLLDVVRGAGQPVHRIRCQHGDLILDDHDHDEGEREAAMGALSYGQGTFLELIVQDPRPCPCLAVQGAWQLPWVSLEPTIVGWRGVAGQHLLLDSWLSGLHDPDPALSVEAEELDDLAQNLQDELRHAPAARAGSRPYALARFRDQLLAVLPAPLRARWLLDRLIDIDARWADASTDDRTTLEAVLFGRLRRAVLASVWAEVAARSGLDRLAIECRRLEPGARPQVEASLEADNARLSVGVPFRWLTDVWAKGMAVIDGQLVLSVASGENGGDGTVGEAATGLAGRPPEGGMIRVTVALWVDQSAFVEVRPSLARVEGGTWRLVR